MNRADLQKLSNIRIREAKTLFAAGEYSGAYYLAGYAVECALKACIAKSVKRHDFPDKSLAQKSYVHDLGDFLRLADPNSELATATLANPRLDASWNLAKSWTEQSRYSVRIRNEAEAIVDAITRRKGRGATVDQATLVNLDVDAGMKVLKTLDDAKLKVTVALWAVSSEYNDWRLILSSPAFDQTHPLKAYEQVAKGLHGSAIYMRPSILILRTKDPFIRDLRRIFGQTKDVNGMRLGGQTIGNRFISDAYVYRIQ